jgi:hypothetical protein
MLQPWCALQAVAGRVPPAEARRANMPTTPIAVQLGEFAAGLRFEDLPAAVVDKAKALVNHAVTVGLVGAGTRARPRRAAPSSSTSGSDRGGSAPARARRCGSTASG